MKRRFGCLFVVLTLSALLWYAVWIEPNRLILQKYTIPINGLSESMTALVIGDFQAQYPWWNKERLNETIQKANSLNADIVFLVGDYAHDGLLLKSLGLDEEIIVPPAETIEAINRLKAPGGVYGILGNHDWWWDGEEIQRLFSQGPVQLLFDESIQVQVGQQRLNVVGLEDIATPRPIDLDGAFSTVSPALPTIVLSHSPDAYELLANTSSFDLLLAGHTHGGQVKLPFLGRPIVPIKDRRFSYGWISLPPHQVVVTGGLGMSILPIRFGVPPELTLLELIPAAK